MNILLDGVPYSVDIGGREYPINYGFRTSILYELLIQDDSISEAGKIEQALGLYFPEQPADIVEAVRAIVWFYSCGSPPPGVMDALEDEGEDGDAGGVSERNTYYSYEHDASYIYAAFLQQYGVDLTEIRDEDLHWWKFRAMFQSLDEKTKIMQIIGIRAVRITDKMSREQQDYYRRQKKIYELPLSQSEVEKQNAIIEALKAGRDVSGLL